jgi:alanine dehydrogenase
MIVGVPNEIKVAEQRVALTPPGIRAFSDAGHEVLFEASAGAGSGFRDHEYSAARAKITDVEGVWGRAELVKALQARGVLAIAYEPVERGDRSLPLLTPMSEVAGGSLSRRAPTTSAVERLLRRVVENVGLDEAEEESRAFREPRVHSPGSISASDIQAVDGASGSRER